MITYNQVNTSITSHNYHFLCDEYTEDILSLQILSIQYNIINHDT